MKLYKVTYQGPLFGKKMHAAITYGEGKGNARWNFLQVWEERQRDMLTILAIEEFPYTAYLID